MPGRTPQRCDCRCNAHVVMQMAQAQAWIWRHARECGADPSHIVVTGHSAGGRLAAMMLASDRPVHAADLPPDLVRRAVPVSGLFELEPLHQAPFLAPDIGLSEAEACAPHARTGTEVRTDRFVHPPGSVRRWVQRPQRLAFAWAHSRSTPATRAGAGTRS